MVTHTTKIISVSILFLLLLSSIIYLIVLFEFYKYQTSIFTPFIPSPPSPFFYPLGIVTPLTQEEIDHRNEIIRASTGNSS